MPVPLPLFDPFDLPTFISLLWCFAVQFIILFFYVEGQEHCDVFAFFVEFFILGSQSWYFVIAVDLLGALRNPFTDPKSNVKLYHVYVHTTSLLAGLLLVGSGQTEYRKVWRGVAWRGQGPGMNELMCCVLCADPPPSLCRAVASTGPADLLGEGDGQRRRRQRLYVGVVFRADFSVLRVQHFRDSAGRVAPQKGPAIHVPNPLHHSVQRHSVRSGVRRVLDHCGGHLFQYLW